MPAADQDGRCRLAGTKERTRVLYVLTEQSESLKCFCSFVRAQLASYLISLKMDYRRLTNAINSNVRASTQIPSFRIAVEDGDTIAVVADEEKQRAINQEPARRIRGSKLLL